MVGRGEDGGRKGAERRGDRGDLVRAFQSGLDAASALLMLSAPCASACMRVWHVHTYACVYVYRMHEHMCIVCFYVADAVCSVRIRMYTHMTCVHVCTC